MSLGRAVLPSGMKKAGVPDAAATVNAASPADWDRGSVRSTSGGAL